MGENYSYPGPPPISQGDRNARSQMEFEQRAVNMLDRLNRALCAVLSNYFSFSDHPVGVIKIGWYDIYMKVMSVGPGMVVTLQAAGVAVNNYVIATALTLPNLLIRNNDGTNIRLDLVYLDCNAEEAKVLTGDVDGNTPTCPEEGVPLALVHVRPGATQIDDENTGSNSYIEDVRVLLG